MDLETFEYEVRSALANLEYVQEVNISPRTPISLKGIVKMRCDYTLSIFYNASFFVLSFSLIFEQNRIWGVDRDNRIGWHIHPLSDPDWHQPTDEKSVVEIISLFDEVMQEFYKKT